MSIQFDIKELEKDLKFKTLKKYEELKESSETYGQLEQKIYDIFEDRENLEKFEKELNLFIRSFLIKKMKNEMEQKMSCAKPYFSYKEPTYPHDKGREYFERRIIKVFQKMVADSSTYEELRRKISDIKEQNFSDCLNYFNDGFDSYLFDLIEEKYKKSFNYMKIKEETFHHNLISFDYKKIEYYKELREIFTEYYDFYKVKIEKLKKYKERGKKI